MARRVQRIQLRRGTASEWASANPTLAAGEPAFDTTGSVYKVGDGVTPWNSLVGLPLDPEALADLAAFTGRYGSDAEPMTTAFGPAPEVLLQDMRRAKGGVIGVGTRTPVALRFDDYEDQFGASLYPLLLARGLPFSRAQISEPIGRAIAGPCNTTTWADIVGWTRNGGEIWNHSATHGPAYPTVLTTDEIVAEVVTSGADIVTATSGAVKVQGFVKPGLQEPADTGPYGSALLDVSDYYTSEVGRLIVQNYALSQAYGGSAFRTIPSPQFHGGNHFTLGEGTLNLANAQANLNRAIERGWGIEFMAHAADIMAGAVMGLADFTTFLDYIVTKWNAGLIEVVTPSGLLFTDKSDQRLDLIKTPDFHGLATSSALWEGSSWTAGQTIETNWATGEQFMRIPNSTGYQSYQQARDLQDLGVGGEAFLVEGVCRSNGAGTTTATLTVTDSDDNSRLNITKTFAGITTAWTKVRLAFTLHPDTDKIVTRIARSAGDGVDWNELHVWKV